jgi:hypothetical protein
MKDGQGPQSKINFIL